MTSIPFAIMLAERGMPLLLFVLYMVTACRICRFAHWQEAGAPNPFLPRRLKHAIRSYENRYRVSMSV